MTSSFQLKHASCACGCHRRYHDIIKGVPFFRTLEEGAIVKICGLLKPFCAMKDDLIYKRGEVGREMYVIMKGSIEISFTDEATKTLGPGQTFGEGRCSISSPHLLPVHSARDSFLLSACQCSSTPVIGAVAGTLS